MAFCASGAVVTPVAAAMGSLLYCGDSAFEDMWVDLRADLVEELVNGRTKALQPSDFGDRQIRVGDVPSLRRHLMLRDPVLRLRTADARPAFPRGVDEVEI